EALEIDRHALPPVPRDVATDLCNVASILAGEGDFSKAEPLFNEALKINRDLLPADFAQYVSTVEKFAGALQDFGRPGDAESLLREALEAQQKKLEPQDHLNDKILNILKGLLLATDRELEAAALAAEFASVRPSTRPAPANP